MKLFMMPQTVPNRPTNGAVAPIVASKPIPCRAARASVRTSSENVEATRSLMLFSLQSSADARISCIAAATMAESTLRVRPIIICASASVPAAAIFPSERRSPHRASRVAVARARKIVQVTSDANTRLIITAFTSGSAARNIVHGESSCSAMGAGFAGDFASPAAADGAGATGDCSAVGTLGASSPCGAAIRRPRRFLALLRTRGETQRKQRDDRDGDDFHLLVLRETPARKARTACANRPNVALVVLSKSNLRFSQGSLNAAGSSAFARWRDVRHDVLLYPPSHLRMRERRGEHHLRLGSFLFSRESERAATCGRNGPVPWSFSVACGHHRVAARAPQLSSFDDQLGRSTTSGRTPE